MATPSKKRRGEGGEEGFALRISNLRTDPAGKSWFFKILSHWNRENKGCRKIHIWYTRHVLSNLVYTLRNLPTLKVWRIKLSRIQLRRTIPNFKKCWTMNYEPVKGNLISVRPSLIDIPWISLEYHKFKRWPVDICWILRASRAFVSPMAVDYFGYHHYIYHHVYRHSARFLDILRSTFRWHAEVGSTKASATYIALVTRGAGA